MTEQRIRESKSGSLMTHQVDKLKRYKVTNIPDATTQEDPIYEQIGHMNMNPIPEANKMPALETYIAMILNTGKEFHAGATYQTQDFSAVCIDERGGVVSIDHYDVTLLLPPLSLHEPCVTIFLYLERLIVKRVHGNPTYASPVVRVGCISNSTPTPFQENIVLSFPLFKYADNQHIVPFYRQDVTELWTELSPKEHAFIKERSRCTVSIDKTGLYTCLNYTGSGVVSSGTNRVVLPMQCSTFVGRHTREDIRIEVAFWLSSETQSEMVAQRQHAGHLIQVDGLRELLLDISHVTASETLVVDVTGICEGWTVYGGKQKHIPLSTIHEEFKRSDGFHSVDLKFRNQGYDVELACRLRIYIKNHEGDKQKLSLFRYNCLRKRSDETNEQSENRISYHRNANNSREILDIIDRCLAHITKIISSNLNGVWEKRFAESLNIPASLVKSSQEIFLINKALYVFVGSRVVSMNDNEIVLAFITAANAVARELENEATERRCNRAAKALSLPHGARLPHVARPMTKPKYNRSSIYSVDVAAHMSRCLVTPPPRPPRRQSMPYYYRRESTESLPLHSEDAVVTSSPINLSDTKSSLQLSLELFDTSTISELPEDVGASSGSRSLHNENVDTYFRLSDATSRLTKQQNVADTSPMKQPPPIYDEVFDASFSEKLTLGEQVFDNMVSDSR